MKSRLLLMTLAVLATGFLATSNLYAHVGPCADPDTQHVAQQPGAPSQVGRLSVIRGQVFTMHADGGAWVAGAVDTPIGPDARVRTADRSQSEIQLDPFNVMRLDKRTEAQVADLRESRIYIRLTSGTVDFSVFPGTCADVEVDTPNMGVHPLAWGLYHIQVASPTKTLVIVRRGEVEILTNRGSTKVASSQMIQVRGGDHPEHKIGHAPARDSFDIWARDRDRQIAYEQAQASNQHTGPDYSAAGDLGNHGQSSHRPAGWCLTPAVDLGWVPYDDGNSDWEPYRVLAK